MPDLYLCNDGETVEGPFPEQIVRCMMDKGSLTNDAQVTVDGEEKDWRSVYNYFGVKRSQSNPKEAASSSNFGCVVLAILVIFVFVFLVAMVAVSGPARTVSLTPEEQAEKAVRVINITNERREAERQVRIEKYKDEVRRR